jgi:glucokinase
MLVVGDIGGTKTLLGLYELSADPGRPVVEKEYRSAAFPDLAPMVRDFLGSVGLRAEYGCFDVAGPVLNGEAHLTNLPWSLQEQRLASDLGLRRVILLNDLRAIAVAVPHLKPTDFETIHAGTPDLVGPVAVVAPGTGLGEAFLIRQEESVVACASEGGHASFAPTNDLECALWQYLRQRFGSVSYERVCSGPGIAHIYDFLRDRREIPESPDLARALAAAKDRTPLIAEAGLQGDRLAAAALDMFVNVLAGEASNFALKIMATGGVYLAGGVPAHLLPLLRGAGFRTGFLNKGRLNAILEAIPVHVVTARAALLGAAHFGVRQFSTDTLHENRR